MSIVDKSKLYSDTPPSHGCGLLQWWLLQHRSHDGDKCLTWPFGTIHGYAILKVHYKRYYAHRYMCELVNGPAPTPSHEASHSCGQGHNGCVNPRHLSWKTKAENQQDRRKHGTVSRGGRTRKLSFETAQRIRLLHGQKSQMALAEQFGVNRTTISLIVNGKTWTRPRQSKSFRRGQQGV